MAVTPGTRLGVYEVLVQIGEGGMGQVYRARDTKLNRDVALKVLPDIFAGDPDRLARFTREAQTLASLNHPNIAHIHGLEESGGVRALVMELVEGEDLSRRIAGGPLPLDEALSIANQIAEALQAAHEQGIVHRDLKPANVKVRADGSVKVLDFGLAKAVEPASALSASAGQGLSMSPTITTPAMTQAGMILGTAAYMAPEQARGRTVDKRADIWAFGCVLFEMLTGTRAFPGEDVTDTLANVLKTEPDWHALPSSVPPAIRTLVQRCLEKDPRRRIADISTARFLISDPMMGASTSADTPVTAPQTSGTPAWQRVVPWATAAVLLAALGVMSFVHFREQPPVLEQTRFEIEAPANTTLLNLLRISPTGRDVAFLARDGQGKVLIWVRSLNSLAARPLPGTDGAAGLFWSADSRSIAFSAGNKLKKVEASGGPVQSVCDLPAPLIGGAWSPDGTIVFGVGGGSRGLMRVSEAGGVLEPLTVLDLAKQEAGHRNPFFLPDGRHFVFAGGGATAAVSNGHIYLGSLDDKPDQQTAKPLMTAEYPNAPMYMPAPGPGPGYLFFLKDGALTSVAFDARRREVTGTPITENGAPNVAAYSASATGVLAFRTGLPAAIESQLLWFDREGKLLGQLGPPAPYGDVQLSPDGKLVVVDHQGNRGYDHLWSADPVRGVFSRVNPGDFQDYAGNAVSPDGRVAFTDTIGGGTGDIYLRLASGAGKPELLVKSATIKHPNHWSLDGRFIVYDDHTAQKQDLWIIPMAGDHKPIPFLATPDDEADANFSPDTRWIAYSSDESGRREVYVQGFVPDHVPAAGITKRQISTAGGAKPRWRRDGKEMYYIASDGKMMAVPVKSTATTFEVGVAVPLFATRTRGYTPYDVAPDGRFLINTATDAATANSAPITVVLNWAAGLKK